MLPGESGRHDPATLQFSSANSKYQFVREERVVDQKFRIRVLVDEHLVSCVVEQVRAVEHATSCLTLNAVNDHSFDGS